MDSYISPNFEYNGFKFIESANGFYIFRRWQDGKLQTVKATRQDVYTGNLYKMIDGGYSRY